MTRIHRPSPNFDDRPAGGEVDILLLHYTGMPTAEEALCRMCDPEAKVSAHYAVDEDGTIISMVEEAKRAWHAGVSSWAGETDINARSIGIEIVNPGHEFGYRAFPEAQIQSVIDLSKEILARHDIPPERVLGHSDVAPSRKEDPGELFPWGRLAAEGVGHYIDPVRFAGAAGEVLKPGASGDDVSVLQDRFKKLGYGLEVSGEYDEGTELIVTAFQRHFRQSRVDGIADAQVQELLKSYVCGAGSSLA